MLGRFSQKVRVIDAARLISEGFQLPTDAGSPLEKLTPVGAVPAGARDMRQQICSREAREKRYEPAAGRAKIESPWLQERQKATKALQIVLGDAT